MKLMIRLLLISNHIITRANKGSARATNITYAVINSKNLMNFPTVTNSIENTTNVAKIKEISDIFKIAINSWYKKETNGCIIATIIKNRPKIKLLFIIIRDWIKSLFNSSLSTKGTSVIFLSGTKFGWKVSFGSGDSL